MKVLSTAELIAKAERGSQMDPAARLRGRKNKGDGARAETLVLSTLRLHGIEVSAIETGWRVVRTFAKGRSRIISATPKAKVLADIVGVLAGGRALLIEIKHEEADRLSWARLDDHQVENLRRWASKGAFVAVAWVRGLDIALIEWPAPSGLWGPGNRLSWLDAMTLNQLPAITGKTRITPTR